MTTNYDLIAKIYNLIDIVKQLNIIGIIGVDFSLFFTLTNNTITEFEDLTCY